MRGALLLCALVACGGTSSDPDAGDPRQDASTTDARPNDATATDAIAFDAAVPTARTSVIKTTHRYIPNGMFGGWGPHLGHLVRAPDDALYLVDDSCDQGAGPDGCDVNLNRRLEYHELDSDQWVLRATLALPAGIQQNTGTIVDEDALVSFGVDIVNRQIVACTMAPATWIGSCAPILPSALPASSNYVGAAISPDGYPVAWATSVVDGGGGSFHWFVDYGGGWNGPRTGSVGGYNDASYINIAFGGGAASTEFVMHAQLVGGLAPNWTFHAAMADGDAASADPVAFAPMAPAVTDALISTNDVFVDPISGDTHVLARTMSGAVAYVHRPAGGQYSAPEAVFASALRARWVQLDTGMLVLVTSRADGLVIRRFPSVAGPLDVASANEIVVPLPDGYAQLYAIYPEAAVYQRDAPAALNVAVVGAARENEVLHVAVDGL